MDALLVGGGLAAGGWLLNAKQENEKNKGVSNKSPDVFDNRVEDSRMYDRQIMNTHLGKDNNVNALYLDRPKSGRSDNGVGSSRSLTGEMRNNSEGLPSGHCSWIRTERPVMTTRWLPLLLARASARARANDSIISYTFFLLEG